MLDPVERRLTCAGEPIELSARYLDALVLMVSESGRLITKDRFMAEVWTGIPVTDEALTQCIRTLRRALGDDATAPRFIATVPRHGYRFLAEVSGDGAVSLAPAPSGAFPVLVGTATATLGGGIAGAFGGLLYASAGLAAPGVGAASTVLVMVSVTLLVGALGGAGVGFGLAASAQRWGRLSLWTILGGALGGLLVGAVAHMLASDVFALFIGIAPTEFTGAGEGALLGAATGIGAWLSARAPDGDLWRKALPGFAAGALAGLAVPLLGGRLMAGSLAMLAERFPQSRLRMDGIGAWFGESEFGPTSHTVASTLEGALFCGGVVLALALGRRLATRG